MARSGNRRLAAMLVASVALTGCAEGENPFAKSSDTGGEASVDATATPSSSVRLVDRDVEAPEVFQVTDEGLWDGRPSLGGVWVASTDAKDPERVIIRNTENGKFVIGALFRRERDNPGPKIQISSDAAEALGLLAGQPGQINVTALRREEAPNAAPDASQPILDAPETVATETAVAEAAPEAKPETATTAATAALDTAAVAAAIDKADGTAPAAELSGEAALADAAPEPEPKKKWWQRKKKPAPEMAEAALADTAVDTAALGATAAAAITAEPLPEAPAAPAAKSSSGGKSLIQLGIFSVEANAQRAADTVTKAGSTATVRKEQSKGKDYWSVVAGPANSAAEREALMAKVKGLGFADAYFVSR